MTIFASGRELRSEIVSFVSDFLESDPGKQIVQRARSFAESVTLTLQTRDPETTVSVDFVSGEILQAATDAADVHVEIYGDDLHNLMMDRLGPVEISQLSETGRLQVSGTPEALAALVLIATEAQPYYPSSLRRRGRVDLLDTSSPPSATVWGIDGPPPPLIESRRPWQRVKSPNM